MHITETSRARAIPAVLIATGSLALLVGCAQPPQVGGLPPPLPGVVVSGLYEGTLSVRGELAGSTVFGPVTANLSVNLTTGQGDVVSGVASLAEAGSTAPPLLRDVEGQNDDGTLSVELPVRLCGVTIEVVLHGTVNPVDTLNFASVNHGSVCGGGLGTLKLDAFNLVQVPQ